MIVIRNSIYVPGGKGYVRCTLHRRTVNGKYAYTLQETPVSIEQLPRDYSSVTWPEIIAKFSWMAIDDDAQPQSPSKTEDGE